jgi:hypothetical protein
MKSSTNPDVRELRRRVGDVSQLVSTREVRLADGNEDGVRAIDVRAAGGLSALVLADRGLDLGPVWAAGHQVGWQSSTGIVHPAHYAEDHWLRSFHGGLLTTCGLQNVGRPSDDEGAHHGLHGRISNTPARTVSHRVVEQDGRLVAEIDGELRETDVFGADLLLRRSLRFPMGEPLVAIHDEVTNQGFADTPFMVLYHVNVGYPVVADGARLVAPPAEVVGRDDHSQEHVSEHADFPAPIDGFREHVFEHRLLDREAGRASISVANAGFAPTGGIAVTVTFDPRQLARLWQWRMLGTGMYVTGLEPANCGLAGRAAEREAGTLQVLSPGESRAFDLVIRVSLGREVGALLEGRTGG